MWMRTLAEQVSISFFAARHTIDGDTWMGCEVRMSRHSYELSFSKHLISFQLNKNERIICTSPKSKVRHENRIRYYITHTRRWMLVAGIAIRFHLLNEIAGSLRATREMATHCQLISGDTKIQWKLRHLNDPKRRNVCSTVNSGDGPRKKYYFFFCRNMAVRWWLINISGDSEADRQVIKSKWLCRTYQNSVSYMYINNGFAQDGAQFAFLLHIPPAADARCADINNKDDIAHACHFADTQLWTWTSNEKKLIKWQIFAELMMGPPLHVFALIFIERWMWFTLCTRKCVSVCCVSHNKYYCTAYRPQNWLKANGGNKHFGLCWIGPWEHTRMKYSIHESCLVTGNDWLFLWVANFHRAHSQHRQFASLFGKCIYFSRMSANAKRFLLSTKNTRIYSSFEELHIPHSHRDDNKFGK